jgi:hypothetical protein
MRENDEENLSRLSSEIADLQSLPATGVLIQGIVITVTGLSDQTPEDILQTCPMTSHLWPKSTTLKTKLWCTNK